MIKDLHKLTKRKDAEVRDLPTNAFSLTTTVVNAVVNSTKGGTKAFNKRIDDFFDQVLIKAAKKSALVTKLTRLISNLSSGPPLKVIDLKKAGKYLEARLDLVKAKVFEIPTDTRRTGGVLEGRGIEFADGSVEIELAGKIEESIAPLRDRDKFKEAGLKYVDRDFSQELKPAAKKAAKGISLEYYDRAHLWGHGFGDEARAGIMYAPKEFNRIWQHLNLETVIRDSAARIRAAGGELIIKAKARSYSPRDLINKSTQATSRGGQPLYRKNQEFLLKEISYEIFVKAPDGSIKRVTRIDFKIPPPGSKDPIVPDIQGVEILERWGEL